MNAVDYFLQDSAGLQKDLLIHSRGKSDYQSLSGDVMRLSRWLTERYKKGEVIILISPNNDFFVTAYLSIMKAGCVCVPLNPKIEVANFNFIREKTGAVYGFIHSSVKLSLIGDLEQIDEDRMRAIIEEHEEVTYKEGPFVGDNHLAQIIFTSGSTSKPKGVMISHGNLIANTQSIVEYLQPRPSDKMLVVLPFFYCYGLSLLHTHIKVGATLVLNNNFVFIGSVLRDMKQHECTSFAGVPSHFQILLRKFDSFRNGHFPHLRYVTQAGGRLHNAFISEFIQLFPEVRFYVMYGQTEATARLSYLPPENLKEKMGSIGKGIPHVTLKVVDEKGFEVVPGQVGEIIARGDNIMLGYFDDEESTHRTLIDGWLHTNDLGTIDEDGYIYLSARKTEIIKVGGKRVGPKEIEEIIVAIPGVVDCTVEGYSHPILGEAVRAIVVKTPHSSLTVERIREFCAIRLAPFKVPTEVVFRNKLELSSTGKKVKEKL